ncbi:hypothetical protein [Kitasatospora cineracea]|uniref:Uncharacterized protein n=1 Tax=Kitasatospora cineracea TaxID=88074 RepID=A0A8G1XET4_9ACTN|nr:hypothetical protein [Kitasatospora cineracea]ROR43102.1 hypothetical protein EDD39_1243 [Kitasatospora cineracea]
MSSDTTPPRPGTPTTAKAPAPPVPVPPVPVQPAPAQAVPAPDAPAPDAWAVQAKADRRRRWQVGAAVLLTVVTGAATAVLVTLPERTDVPGLATPNDGRYAFPELTLPPLPSGASAPSDYKIRTHAADLRGLLLPPPKGAVAATPPASPPPTASPSPSASPSGSGTASPAAVPSLPPVAGRWVPCDRDAMLAADDAYTLRLTTDACRGAAAQGWTAADGTRTELRLLHFGTGDEAADFFAGALRMTSSKDIASWHLDVDGKYPVAFGQVDVRLSDAQAGGMPTGRIGWVQSGDVVAVVQLTNPRGVPLQAFRQVVALQSGLLA